MTAIENAISRQQSATLERARSLAEDYYRPSRRRGGTFVASVGVILLLEIPSVRDSSMTVLAFLFRGGRGGVEGISFQMICLLLFVTSSFGGSVGGVVWFGSE